MISPERRDSAGDTDPHPHPPFLALGLPKHADLSGLSGSPVLLWFHLHAPQVPVTVHGLQQRCPQRGLRLCQN